MDVMIIFSHCVSAYCVNLTSWWPTQPWL